VSDCQFKFPTGWQVIPLDQCMGAIIDYRGKSPEKTTHGIPLITAKIVKNGWIEKPAEFISVSDFDGWMRRGMPEPGDVVMTTEAPLGEIAQLDSRKVALAQRLITLRGKPALLDNNFLKFAMQSEFIQQQLKARATGTTVLGIRQSELRRVLLPVPPLAEQNDIAKCLGSLDGRIDLNRRMNETLEEIARAIFKSWFGGFYPVSVADQRDGWKDGEFGDVAENIRIQVTPGSLPETTPYIGLEHMPRKSIALTEWGTTESLASNKFAFKSGDILFGKLRPYFHKVGVAAVDGVCSTDVLVIRPKHPVWFSFVLGHASSSEMVDFTNAGSTGTKMPRTSWDELRRFKLSIPPSELAQTFNAAVFPLVQRIQANIHESRTLASARDALLPKLLSGQLRIAQDPHATGVTL
jgi:type I restriction enzyme, S subunit